MAKKKPIDAELLQSDVQPEPIELSEEVAEVAPVAEPAKTLPAGFVHINRIGKGGNGIIVKSNQWGTIYKEDQWEIISTKKK